MNTTFEELKIDDVFETETGTWTVYDKGTKTLIAYKNEKGIHPEDTAHIIFYNYEFPSN